MRIPHVLFAVVCYLLVKPGDLVEILGIISYKTSEAT
jgi:hypothetical protein